MYKERRFGGRNDRPRNSFGSSRGSDRGPREMHDAVCDECGKPCRVPFRPSGDKPIYCSDCFERRGGGERRNDSYDNRDRHDHRDRGGDDRGGYRNRRSDDRGDFRDRPTPHAQGISQEQFDMLNEKLDRILKSLSVVVPRRVEDHVEGEEERYEFQEKKKVRVGGEEEDQAFLIPLTYSQILVNCNIKIH